MIHVTSKAFICHTSPVIIDIIGRKVCITYVFYFCDFKPFKGENYIMRTPEVLKNVAMLLLSTVEYVIILNQ